MRMADKDNETLAELVRRTAMLDAVGYAATQIVAAADWRAGIQELLDRLGRATGVSRVTFFEVHEGGDGSLVQSCRYDWAEPGLAPLASDPRYRDMRLNDDERPGELGAWSRRRQQGEVIQATLADVSGYARQVFQEHGTLAFVSVPIMVSGRWWGFLGFDECKRERVWSPLEIEVLKTAAALIAGAIERARAGERLRLSEERYAMAARGANDGLWDWDIETGSAYFSPRLHEILGLAEGALDGRMEAFYDLLPAEAAAALQHRFTERFARGRHKFEFELSLPGADGTNRWFVLRGLIVYREGAPRRIVGGLRDITGRKLAEGKLVETERKRASLARYFSPNMVDELMRENGQLASARIQVATVLFVDLVGFTGVTARLPGVEVIALLRECLGLFEEAVFAHGGTLDKYLGDGLMATFGTPRPGPDDASRATASARAMAEKVVEWNTRRRAAGLPALQLGIGLHTGEVALGDIGSARRLEFAVIGDTVNVASRIEEMTRELDIAILASDATLAAVRQEGRHDLLAGFRDMGLHSLRGREGAIRLWGRAAEE
jgi:PAS domain S-box-containing protein